MLGVPLVSIDTLAIDPGFVVHPLPVFHARLRAALDAAPNGWVVDGKNTYSGAEMAFAEATDLICQSKPFARVHSDSRRLTYLPQGWTRHYTYTSRASWYARSCACYDWRPRAALAAMRNLGRCFSAAGAPSCGV